MNAIIITEGQAEEIARYMQEPVIMNVEDWGDRDAHLWEVFSWYKDQVATASGRDLEAAKALAVERVKAKILGIPATPETDHDFAEVE